ncbi:uncharacterized protein LOC103520564 [Diaphorina citri]|uniref:Uncharacterized protein LOC103520564 n=1 Tax=Diaphorina citri TaxID=121845 RepID=A0A1S3DL62_DIACI|nr:uncharacterized protein LOC103520564 [Diaphorina citri]
MPKLKRSSTEIQSPDSHPFLSFSAFTNGKSLISVMSGRRWADAEGVEKKTNQTENGEVVPFRDRASTDGHLLSKARKWRYPLLSPSSSHASPPEPQEKHNTDRRMSISMRGANASY